VRDQERDTDSESKSTCQDQLVRADCFPNQRLGNISRIHGWCECERSETLGPEKLRPPAVQGGENVKSERERQRQRQREGEKGIPEGGSREIEPRNWKWSRLQE
jgi:hypothetical protein